MRGKLLGTWAAVVLAVVVLGRVAPAGAEVKLPGVFGDHMVLQREMAVPVWGWAEPGEKVSVSLGPQTGATQADAQGKWSLKLAPLEAGGPYTLAVRGTNLVQMADVLVGEVWLCSGQSNMAMTVGGVDHKEAEIAAANFPQIRMLGVRYKTAEEPLETCGGQWQVCSPKTVGGFSAAGYFFGRRLHQELKVPVGLINSSVGGTPIQGWTSVAAHAAVPRLAVFLTGLKRAIETWDPDKAKQVYRKQLVDWETAAYKARAAGKPFKAGKPRLQPDPRLAAGSPGRLYNGMIAPLAPYAIRGAIWYQGEANAGGASLYGTQLRTMINSWRQVWQEGDFPFIYVQLPNFMKPQEKPAETGGWPLIREQFLRTLALANTGMAVTIDIGLADNIHPTNKQEVGRRLAQWALAKTYGRDLVACGPLYKSMHKEGDKIVLEFDYAEGGLRARQGEKLKGFAIAGDNKKFVWAEARIEGRSVAVWSPEVKNPAAVRYAWADNPDCNLYNQAGLPASPLRTDDWAQ